MILSWCILFVCFKHKMSFTNQLKANYRFMVILLIEGVGVKMGFKGWRGGISNRNGKWQTIVLMGPNKMGRLEMALPKIWEKGPKNVDDERLETWHQPPPLTVWSFTIILNILNLYFLCTICFNKIVICHAVSLHLDSAHI